MQPARTRQAFDNVSTLPVWLSDGLFRYARTWPATPRGLSGALRRAAPGLRSIGVRITFGDHTRQGSQITVMAER